MPLLPGSPTILCHDWVANIHSCISERSSGLDSRRSGSARNARQRQLVEFGEGLSWPNSLFRHCNLGLTACPLRMGSLLRNWYGIAPAQADGL
jgi:hypothetical protein